MNKPKVFFRADGNQNIGHGHVYRTLAVAEMISKHYECIYIIQEPSEDLISKIKSICTDIIIIDSTPWKVEAKFIAQNYLSTNDIIVTDGYNFNTEYQSILKSSNASVLCIDDLITEHFVSDAVLNHAGGISIDDYSAEPYTQLFLGLKYALLSKEFRHAASNRKLKSNNNVFICMGGADPTNQLQYVLNQIKIFSNQLQFHVIIGSAYQHTEELNAFINENRLNISVHSNLSSSEMLQLMNNCRQAITTPSTVSYEYLSSGGILYLHQSADNQKKIYSYLINEGIAFSFSNFPNNNKQIIEKALVKQEKIFDGNQQKRMLRIFKFLNLNIRTAELKDCKLYHKWANDPETRSQSYNQEPIPYASHERWFNEKINSKNSELFIISEDKEPVGQIRFEIENKQAVINYSIAKKHRGKGLSTPILLKGISEFKRIHGNNEEIIGYVKKSNIASAKAFRSINFKEDIASEIEDSYKYTWQ